MAASAARAGFAVTAIDAFGDLDQHANVKALSVPRDFGAAFTAQSAAEASRTIDCDAVAYLSPFENHPSAVAELSRGRMLWGNGPSVLRRARDPSALGTNMPSGDRWLVKPFASGGGHGIRWWTQGEPVPRGSYVQPYIDGIPGSIVFVAANGRAVPFGLTRQLIGDPAFGASEFRYCGSILSTDAWARAAFEQACKAASEHNLVGVNCVDFMARGSDVFPIEVNPRWSASMELAEDAYGLSVFGIHAAACTTGELPSFDLRLTTQTPAFGKAIVFARHDVVCGDTQPWLSDRTVRDVPHPGEHIPAGKPVCTVFANGTDVDACYSALVNRARQVYELLEMWSSAAV